MPLLQIAQTHRHLSFDDERGRRVTEADLQAECLLVAGGGEVRL